MCRSWTARMNSEDALNAVRDDLFHRSLRSFSSEPDIFSLEPMSAPSEKEEPEFCRAPLATLVIAGDRQFVRSHGSPRK